MVGVSRTAVTRWESDLDEPDPRRLPKIAKALGLSVEELTNYHVPHDTRDEEAPGAEEASGAAVADVRSADYWRGRQDTLLEIMEHVSVLHAQALKVQREIVQNTIPQPRTDLTPQQRAGLAGTQAALAALETAEHEGSAAQDKTGPPTHSGSTRPRRKAGGSKK